MKKLLKFLVAALVLISCGDGRLSPQGGTIVGVVAGNGLTGGGMTGIVTLNVSCGYGLTCLGDTIEVNNGVIVDGSGTMNYVPLWTPDGNTLGNSIMSQSGFSITVTGSLDVTGAITDTTNRVFSIAGNGLTSSGATVNVGAGTGITVNADDVAITTNGVTNALLRQSAGLSVVGNATNGTANVADITGTDGQVLRVSGTTLAFGSVPETSISGLCTTSNTVPKGDGAGGEQCSDITENGTAVTTTLNLVAGNATTDRHTLTGSLREITANPAANQTGASWGDNFAVFGPNASSNTGSALGITYNTTDGNGLLIAATPNSAFLPMVYGASSHQFNIGTAQTFRITSGLTRTYKGASIARVTVGDDTELTTNGQSGFSPFAFSDGNIYIDSKSTSGGTTKFRSGAGTEAGNARTWLTVTNSTGAAAFGNALTVATSFGAGGADTRALDVTTDGVTTVRYDDTTLTRSVFLVNRGIDSAADGTGIEFDLAAGAAAAVVAGSLDFIGENTTHTGATADGTFSLKVALNSTLTERLKIQSDGTTTHTGAMTTSGLLTATAGGTTPANWTTTGTGSVVSANDVTAVDQVGAGTASPVGQLSVLSLNSATDYGAGAWDREWSVFGPNSASATGAALGLAYSTTNDESQISSVAPGVAWKKMTFAADNWAWKPAGSTTNQMTLSSGGLLSVPSLSTQNSATLGDNAADAHTINGAVTHSVSGAGASGYSYNVSYTASATTADRGVININNAGTYDATAAARVAYGVVSQITATRSAGANNLTSFAGYFSASGAQDNRAIYTFDGSNFFNVNSGTSTFYGNVTIGDSSSLDSHIINGPWQQIVTGAGISGNGILSAYSGTAVAGDRNVARFTNNGTYDATAAGRTAYALVAETTATRSAGANNLINYGGYFNASGGQINFAITSFDGEVALNTNSGNTCIGSTGCTEKLRVAGSFSEIGNATLGNATTDSHTINGAAILFDDIGAAFVGAAGLFVRDTTAFATGVGGALYLGGKYNTAGSYVDGAVLKAAKTNSTDGNYSTDLLIATTPNGGVQTEAMRIESDQDTKLSGRLGVGVSPSSTIMVDVRDSSTKDAMLLYHTGGAGTYTASADFFAVRNDDTSTSYDLLDVAVANDDTKRLRFTSAGTLSVGGAFQVDTAGTVTDANSAVLVADETVVTSGTIADTTNGIHLGFASNVGTISAEQPGTAYRRLLVGGADVWLVTGGAARVDVQSTGKVLLGDTSNTSVDNNVDVLTIGNTGTGQTTSGTAEFAVNNTGSYSSSGGNITHYLANLSSSATESAGSNTFTNVGLRLSVTSGDIRKALFVDNGAAALTGDFVDIDDHLFVGGAPDIADTLIAGFYYPETGAELRYNWLHTTDTLTDGGACVNDIWCQNEISSTLAYTTSSQTSPRGFSETVGQLTCTNGGGSCSTAGTSYYQFDGSEGGVNSGSIPYTDARNKTVTFSVFLKASSGTPTAVISIWRDGGVEQTDAACTLSTSTWTRCSVTKTLSNTNLADNSEIIVTIEPRTTSAIYMWGAQLEESAFPTPYQRKTGYTVNPNGFILTNGSFTNGNVIDYQMFTWAQEIHVRDEPFITYGSTSNSGVSIYGGTGYLEATDIGVRNDLIVSADLTVGGQSAFSNGPSGINIYSGTHFEWAEDYTGLNGSLAIPTFVGMPFAESGMGLAGSGTGTTVTPTSITGFGSNRPGIVQFSTGSTSTGYAGLFSNNEAFSFNTQSSSVFEAAVAVVNLSTSSEEYQLIAGFFDTVSSPDQADGCYFIYDRGDVAANPATGDTGGISGDNWSIWCASNSTRTGYKLDGTASEDSFTTVTSTVAAATYYRLKVVMEGTSKARFYINGSEVGRITTNIPNNATTRLNGAGVVIKKSTGSTGRTMNVDQTRISIDLSAAR